MSAHPRVSRHRASGPPRSRFALVAAGLALLPVGPAGRDATVQERSAFIWETAGARAEPRATSTAFEAEMGKGRGGPRGRAAAAFAAAEREYSGEAYADAARSYENSIAAFPTMAARLNLGHAFLRLEQPAAALRTFREGLETAQTADHTLYAAAFLENIGNIYADGGRPGEALQGYAQALELYRGAREALGEGYTLVNTASLLSQTGKLAKADSDLAQARAAFEREEAVPEALTVLAHAYEDLGNVHARGDSLDRAVEGYSSAAALYERALRPTERATALKRMGMLYARQGKRQQALAAWEEARAIFHEAGLRESVAEVEASIDSLESMGAGCPVTPSPRAPPPGS